MSPLFRGRRREAALERMFQTQSHAWEQAGLAPQLSVQAASRARREAIILVPLVIGVLIAYHYQHRLFGKHIEMPVRIGTVVALLALGWALARAVGRALGPTLFRRMDPATAGTIGFLIRLFTIGITLVVALRIAGIQAQTLAVGGAFTAVIFGLAAQQTLGNVIAGTVLLSARPFRVGERVRLQAGGVGGNVEGVVSSLGLLYLTLASGADRIMVPNSVVLSAAIIPIKEPESVDLRARLPTGTRPSELQRALDEGISVTLRQPPHIALEELDGQDVVLRIAATPDRPRDGRRLADEILAVVRSFSPADAEPTTDDYEAPTEVGVRRT